MKKEFFKLNLLVILGLVALGQAAKAAEEMVVAQSTLVELDSGDVVNDRLGKSIKVLSGGEMVFAEEIEVVCVVAPCPPVEVGMRFQIADVQPAGCGSRRVIAYQVADQNGFADQFVPARLEVIDHSDRLCRDFRPYRWEVSLVNEFGETRHFGGNPHRGFASQSEKE